MFAGPQLFQVCLTTVNPYNRAEGGLWATLLAATFWVVSLATAASVTSGVSVRVGVGLASIAGIAVGLASTGTAAGSAAVGTGVDTPKGACKRSLAVMPL